jgi:IclR family mhp operon transcriptional activator
MPSFPPVEATLRTLRVLECLNRYPVTGIALLHRQTGIPKPSLVRLLQTLEGAGYVRHESPRGGYMLTSKVRVLASGFHSEPRIVEVLAPLIDALFAEVKWPVALVVPDGDAAVIRYTTTPRSPLALLHSTIDMRLSMVTRALGLAYLAFCDPQERELIIEAAARSDDPENQAARRRRTLDATLELIRRQGYALRDPQVRPVSNTIAVPVYDAHRAVGAIGLTWFTSTMDTAEAVRRYLAPMQALAARAHEALCALDGDAAPPDAQAAAGAS